MIISWRLAWKFQDPFISDWDGFDYTVYAVKNLPSALGLSRALFLGVNHLLWKIAHELFHVPLESAYLVFRYGVIIQSGPAVVGIYALCKELTANRMAAAAGTLIVAVSPFYITYSGRIMSEIPAFLMLSWSLWWMFRSLRLGRTKSLILAALLIGASANIREFAVFYLWIVPVAAYLSGSHWRTCILAFVVAIFGTLLGPLFWTIYSYDYYVPAVINWYKLSAQERRIHNVSAANFYFLRTFSYQCSVAATLIAPFAIPFLARRRGLYGLKLLTAAGLLADLAMLINHDLVVNPRYLLTGLLGLALVSGWAISELAKWRPEVAGGVALIVTGLSIGVFIQLGKENYDQLWNARAEKRYLSRIEFLPENTVFIAGARTPLINFYVGLGARPEWKTIQSGSGWPDERLGSVIDQYLAEGRPVYVDFNKDLWQLGARETAREWVGLEMIRNNYQIDHIHDEFYRIVRRQRSRSR